MHDENNIVSVGSAGEALASARHSSFLLGAPQSLTGHESVLAWPEIVPPYRAASGSRDYRVYVLNDVELGYRFIPHVNGERITTAGLCPGYYPMGFDHVTAHKPQDMAERQLLDSVFVPLAFKFREYGHFLFETMPRMLAIRELNAAGIGFPIIVSETMPSFIEEALTLILPDSRRIVINEYIETVRLRRAWLPTIAASDFSPEIGAMIDRWLESRGRRAADRKLFLRRKQFMGNAKAPLRILTNEDELAAIAAHRGFECVAPEVLSFEEQVDLFSGATIVVGEASSALHNTIFSPAGTKVLSLSWMNAVQSALAELRNHSLDVLPPADGKLRLWSNRGDVSPEFTIDPGAFDDALSRLLVA